LKFQVLLVFLLFCGTSFAANTWYVSPSGNDSNNGSASAPWKTIGYAIYTNSSVVHGDTIIVMDGNYNETPTALNSLYFTKRLHIVGQNRWGATVFINQSSGNIFYVGTSNVSIENLSLRCYGSVASAALFYQSSSGLNFTNNNVTGCNYAVSVQTNTSNVKITGNYHTNAVYGAVSGMETVLGNFTFANNTLDNCSTNGNAGVSFSATAATPPGIVIENLTILNTRNGTGAGVYFKSTVQTAYPTVIRNIQCGNATTLYDGQYCVYVQTPGNVTVSNVTAFMNINTTQVGYEYGVRIAGPAVNVTVNNSTICSAANPCAIGNGTYGAYGIYMTNVNDSFVQNNNLYFGTANNTAGISINGNSSNNVIEGNYISFSGQLGYFGILVSNPQSITGYGSNNTIRNNTVVSSTIALSYALGAGAEGGGQFNMTGARIENNTVNVNASGSPGIAHALFLGYTVNSTVKNNSVTGGWYNFVIKGNENCTVANNTGIGPQSHGIYDKGSHNCLYANNTLQNATYPFYLEYNPVDNRTTVNATITDNTISGGGTILCGAATGISVTNTSGESAVSFGSSCNLTRYWWLNLSSNQNTTFAITNSSGTLFYNQTATSARTSLAQYNVTSGVQTNLTNYTVTASKVSYATQSQNVSMTDNRQLSFTMQTSTPSISLLYPATGGNTSLLNSSFTWLATDSLYASFNCSLYINGTLNQSNVSTSNNTATSAYATSNFTYGSYNWSVNCTNSLGNSNASPTYAFYVTPTAVYGNASTINTTFSNVSATINGTNATDGSYFNATLPVIVATNGSTILAFMFNFSISSLNFSAISINNTTVDGRSFFSVSGIPSSAIIGGKNITIYGINTAYGYVCVKDEENVNNITLDCTGATETSVACDGASHGGYTCTISGTNLTVAGLNHSGVQQYQPPATSTNGDGTGGARLSLSQSFNCSSGVLTVSATSATGAVSGVEVRLYKSGTRDYISNKTDSQGNSRFAAPSGKYYAESLPNAPYSSSYLDTFFVPSCAAAQPGPAANQTQQPGQQPVPVQQTPQPPLPPASNNTDGKNATSGPQPEQKPAEKPSPPVEIPQIKPEEVKQVVEENALPGIAALGMGALVLVLGGAVAYYMLKMRKEK